MLVLHISKDSTIRNPANPAKLNPRRPLVIYGRSFSSGSKQPLKEGAIPPSNEAFKLAHKPRRGWNCAGTWRCKLARDFFLSPLIFCREDLSSGSKETVEQSECEARKQRRRKLKGQVHLGLQLQTPYVDFEPTCFLCGSLSLCGA